jgi:saccharopine dehydrogenase-like NADP-dependent oxidoreductase
MRIVVFGGSGTIGSAVAWELARDPEVQRVGLVGRRADALQRTKAQIDSPKVAVHVATADDHARITAVMKEYDVGVLALPDRRADGQCLAQAIAARLDVVDMLEDYHRRPDPSEQEGLEVPAGLSLAEYGEQLHAQAVANSVTVLDGMGFAPGLSNLTLGEGIRQLDHAESAVARVGGIPSRVAAARHPLGYMITWDFAHVLREYMVRVKVIKDGQVREVPAGSDLETFRFRECGQDAELECAITAGMPSLLCTRSWLRECVEKTIRWPGHWQGVQTFKECGLLDLEPVEYEGTKVIPREFLRALLSPRLKPRPGETDVCVMYNTVTGQKDGRALRIEYFLWEEADTAHGLSAMQRTTGFPVAIAARLLAKGQIAQKGIVPPEEAIAGELYQEFLAALASCGIAIRETHTELA